MNWLLVTSSRGLYLCWGLFFLWPLQVKLCTAYLPIKQRTSLTPFLASFSSLAPFFPSTGPFSASPCPFLSDRPSQWGYRAPTCLHLPPASVARWVRRTKSLLSVADIHPESLFSQPLTPGHGNRGRNVRSDWQDKERGLSLPAQADLRYFQRQTMVDLGLIGSMMS